MFLDRTRHFTIIPSYFLGYHSDHSISETILGFLCMFSFDSKPTIIYNFSHFIVEAIHEQFVKIKTEQVFKYASVLVYLFIYFREINSHFL